MRESTIEPLLGDIWRTRDHRDSYRTIKIVGFSSTHILVKSVSVRRVRRDIFPRIYVFVRRGSLARGEEVSVVDNGGNPYNVQPNQRWRAVGERHGVREVTVIEVDIDEGYAIVRSDSSGRSTKIRLTRFHPNSTGYVMLEDNTRKATS